jgi:autotransporter-associated beta strand protein
VRAEWAVDIPSISYLLTDSSTTTSPFSGGNSTTLNVRVSGPGASWVVGSSGAPVDLVYAARQAANFGRYLAVEDGGEIILYSNHAQPGAIPAVTALSVATSDVQHLIDGRIRVYDSSGLDQQTGGFTYASFLTHVLLQVDDQADVYVESAADSAALRASGGFNLSMLRGTLVATSSGNEAYGLSNTSGSFFVANNTMEAAITATAGGNEAYGIHSSHSVNGTVSGATFGATLDITGSIMATAADQAYGIYANAGMNVRVVAPATVGAIADSGTQAYALFSGSGGSSQVEIVAGASILGMLRFDGPADSLVLSGAAINTTTLDAIMGVETISMNSGQWMLDGVISGASALSSSGAVVVHLNAANTFSGGVDLGGGTITVGDDAAFSASGVTVSANSTLRSDADDRYLANDFSIAGATSLTVDGANDLELAGDLSGAGGVTKSGAGTLVLSGNNGYGGATTVGGGRLVVDGQVTSDVATAPATTLGGSGTIVGNVNNGGIVAPGNSVGTLTINGSYTHSSGANLEIEINDAGTTPGVNVDWLDVSGTATIQGGTVDVVAEAGSYTPFSQYTFLTAGSVSGTFDSVTDNLAFLDAVLGYTGTSVNFILLPNNLDFSAAGATFNQRAVGGYLDDNLATMDSDWQAVVAALFPLTNQAAQSGLAQMSGEVYGTAPQIGIQSTTLLMSSLARHLRPQGLGRTRGMDALWPGAEVAAACDDSSIVLVAYRDDGTPEFYCGTPCVSEWTAWTLGFGIGGDAWSDGNAASLDYTMGSAMVGIERRADADHRLGLYGGYVGTGIRTRGPVQSNDASSAAFGGYLVRERDWRYTLLVAGFQYDDLESERFVQFGGIDRTAHAGYDGWQGYGYLEQGVTLAPTASAAIQPFGALQYVHLRQNGFTETGAGVLNLQVSGENADSLRTFCGVRVNLDSPFGPRWQFTPELRAVWIHEMLDTNSLVNARFAPIGGSSFTIRGLDLGRDWVQAGVGANWDLSGGWLLSANYDTLANDRQVAHVGSGNVSYLW